MHLGGVQELQVDVRIIAATNVDLRQLVKEGKFREDLYYRLNVITIDLPPLRNRTEDIPLLVHHFLKHFSEENGLSLRQISSDALRALMSYICSCNDAYVHLQLLHSPQMHEAAILQDTQYLRLRLHAHGANLIKEQGAAIRDLEQAFLRGDSAGERALHMSKECRFEQVRRHRPSIYRDKCPIFARRVRMDSFRDQLFTGPTLALD